jgi:hypothetical protein
MIKAWANFPPWVPNASRFFAGCPAVYEIDAIVAKTTDV